MPDAGALLEASRSWAPPNRVYDAAVVGAGFGGLGAALRLAERGARVLLVEALGYPGGCASTFGRAGYRFEAGATLFSGFGPGQLFRRWIDRYGLAVQTDWLDPVVEVRTPTWQLPVGRERRALLRSFCAMPKAPERALRRFFSRQRRVADLLWSLLERPQLLNLRRPGSWWAHARNAGRYARLLPLMGKPLMRVLERDGVASFEPLVTYLDALCQITVQCGVREAEAPFGLATMDYYARGTAHVRGGIERLAWGLIQALRSLGADVVLQNRAERLHRGRDGLWNVHTRRGPVRARTAVLNVLPQTAARLLGERPEEGPLAQLGKEVEAGWGACMLYAAARPPEGARDPQHLELIADPTQSLTRGNHVFCSISGTQDGDRAPEGERTMTVSTHVPMRELRGLAPQVQADYVAGVQERMRRTLEELAPEWHGGITFEMTASPRTFERFTDRYLGFVGGVPRRAGLHNYRRLNPQPLRRNLYLVGDSVFPGQSTLATATGGCRVADRVRL